MLRLDFWGSLIELIGLVILLSFDVPFLQRLLMRWPSLERRHNLLVELKADSLAATNLGEWFQTFHKKTLMGADIAPFMRLFPDRDQKQKMPQSLGVFAHYDNRRRFPNPWIYPSVDQEGIPPLATPLPLPDLFTNEENDIRKRVYTLGFVLMFLGSVMFLIHAAWR